MMTRMILEDVTEFVGIAAFITTIIVWAQAIGF